MARARNIKPSLFKNEVLGVADPLYTLLFEGLWMLADREGRLEDRPMRIKADVFPYRDGLDMEQMLDWLQSREFIRRYAVDGKSYILVTEFHRHQNPHKNEAPSEIPAPIEEVATHKTSGSSTSEEIGTGTESTGSARADSLVLIPDSLIPDSLTPAPAPRVVKPAEPSPDQVAEEFEVAWREYPSRLGGNSKADALKAFRARRKDGASAMELTEGVRRYANYVAVARIEPRYVKQAATFFGPGLHFRDQWTPPVLPAHHAVGSPPPSRQSALEARNAATAARVLEKLNAGG